MLEECVLHYLGQAHDRRGFSVDNIYSVESYQYYVPRLFLHFLIYGLREERLCSSNNSKGFFFKSRVRYSISLLRKSPYHIRVLTEMPIMYLY